MQYDVENRRRRSIRLKGYDYSREGAYFITICTSYGAPFFHNGSVFSIAEQCLLNIPAHFPDVELDEWVIMPNHVHFILSIVDWQLEAMSHVSPISFADVPKVRRGVQLNAPTIPDLRQRQSPSRISPRSNTLSVIIRTYKGAVTTICRRSGYEHFKWQRNYYERVVRNEDELNRLRQYIVDNPLQWELDENNPDGLTGAAPTAIRSDL